MKKALKRSLSFLLAIALIFSSTYVGLSEVDFGGLFAVRAEAASSGTTGSCTWSLEGTVLKISGNGKMGEYTSSSVLPWGTDITEVIIEDGVTNIGKLAFYRCSQLTSITIPQSVTSIGNSAFVSCVNLEKIYWNAKNVADFTSSSNIFSNTGTSGSGVEIVFGDTVESIPAYLLTVSDTTYCPLITKVTIGDNVKSIGRNAFANCTSLAAIDFSDSVTNIGVNAFYNTAYYNDGSNWIDNVFYMGKFAIRAKTSLSGECVIKDGTKTIADGAFYNCTGLTAVTIPDSVISIGNAAFYNCTGLTAVTIPDSVTSIGSEAFYKCTKLNDLYITDLGAWCEIAFDGDSNVGAYYSSNPMYYAKNLYVNGVLTVDINIPDGTTKISAGAFRNNETIEAVVIPDSVTEICESAFYDCSNLSSVTIPDSIAAIGNSAFCDCEKLENLYISDIAAWCEIDFDDYNNPFCNPIYYAENVYLNGEIVTELVVPEGVTSISSGAFYGFDAVTSLEMPNSVTVIEDEAFYNCTNLASVVLSENLTTIGRYAFSGCSSLTEIDIGLNVTYIGYLAFGSSTSLKALNVASQNPNYTSIDGVLFNKNLTTLIKYPAGKTNTKYVIPESVTKVDTAAFSSACVLNEVAFGKSINSIGFSSFSGCDGLETINIPKSVTSIGQNAFANCDNLSNIIFEDGGESLSLDYMVFMNCASLKSITLPGSIESISSRWFSGCTNLESVVLKEGVKSICADAFNDCSALASVDLPNSLETIEAGSFSNCPLITEIVLPKHVSSFGVNYSNTEYQNLKDIKVSVNNTVYSSQAGVLYNKDKTKIEYYPNAKTDSVFIVPDTVSNLNGEVFATNQSLKALIVGSGVSNVDLSLLRNFESVTIPDTVSEIIGPYYEEGASLKKICGGDKAREFAINYGYEYVDLSYHDCVISEAVVDTDSTCVANGQMSNHCMYCGVMSNITTTDKAEHIYGEQVIDVPATCTTKGSVHKTCKICDNTVIEIIDPLEHDFSENHQTVVEPTCESDGETARICSNCGAKTDVTVISATGHTYDESDYEYVQSSQAENIYSKKYICIDCGAEVYSAETYIAIKTADDFKNIGNNLSANYVLMNDINLGGEEFEPFANEFSGVFDGNNHTISGVCITAKSPITYQYTEVNVSVSGEAVGLFPVVTGVIKNLNVCGSMHLGQIDTYYIRAGAIAGSLSGGTIQNCHANLTWDMAIDSQYCYIGGLVGMSSFGAQIKQSSNSSDIKDTGTGATTIAGITGGIVGWLGTGSTVEECYNTGDLKGYLIGGIVGRAETGRNIYVNTVKNCYNTGNFCNTNAQGSAGNIVAACYGPSSLNVLNIENCYSVGQFNNCSSSSNEIGKLTDPYLTVSGCYCLATATYYGTGTTKDADMQLQSTFMGYDFDNVWVMDASNGYLYPQLRNNPHKESVCQHTYGDWVVDTIATCTKDGIKHRTCSSCGNIENETIAATGHNYGELIVEREASCTEDGFGYRTCVNYSYGTASEYCEYRQDEVIPKTGHNYSSDWTIDIEATCTENGSKSHHCLNCGDKADVTEIVAPGHIVGEWVVTTEPTCSQEGEKTGYCGECGSECATEAVATLEHNYDENDYEYVQNPENPNEFHKQYKCEDCGSTKLDETPFILKAIIIESLPDNTSYIEGQEIDTTGLVVKAEFEDGTTTYITDYEISYDNSVTGEQEVTVSCGDTSTTFTVTFTAKTLVSIAVTKMPDKTTYVAGDSFDKTGMVVTATYDNGLSEEVTDYTVSTLPKTAGSKNLIVTYSGKRVIIQVTVIEKKAVSMTVVEPEKFEYVLGDEFDPTGMVVTVTFNNGAVEEVTDYTIEGFGEFTGVGYVTLKYDDLTYDLIVLMHAPADSWVIETQATCTENGVKHLYCTECGEIAKTEAVLATGHDYSTEWTVDKAATCTEEGSKSYHCLICDEKSNITVIEKAEHSYGDYVYDLDNNTQSRECTVCGYTLTETIPTEGIFTFVLSDDGTYYILSDCSEAAIGEIEIPSTYKGLPVTSIGKRALGHCISITSVIIPDSVISVDEEAFAFCEGLVSVTFEGNLENLGEQAFVGCSSLESIDLPYGITCIGEETFGDCFSLEKVTIPNTVTSIGLGAFVTCTSLKSIEIPDSVTSIGACAFANCTNLVSIEISDNVTDLGEAAFGLCQKLKYIKIPEGITNLEKETFRGCSSLESIVISNKLTSIGEDCFCDCIDFKYIFYTGSEEQWKDIAISDTTEYFENAIIHYNSTDHTYKWNVTIDATCTEYGEKVQQCVYCDLQKGTEVIPATGHTYGNWYLSYPSVTNCEEDSVYNRQCEICYNTEEWIEPARGVHEIYESMITVEGTCITPGQKLFECKYCEYVKFHEEYYADHIVSGEVIVSESGCETEGEKYNICLVCNGKVGESIITPALGHDYSDEFTVDVEATCKTEGSKSRHCSRCDSKIDVTVIEASTHLYGDWIATNPATCEADGERTRTCVYCGDAVTELVAALGHVYSILWTTDKTPTCTVAGSKSHHCNRPDCDSRIDITEIEPLGHSFGEWQILENPSCTINGQRYRKCNTCYSEELEVITAPGHSYGEWIIDSLADCENDGARHAVCGVCSYVNNETVKAYGHDYESVFTVDKEATCTEAGFKSHHCSRCEARADITTVLALGHHISTMWTIDTEPTCENEGSKSHHCLRCDIKADETVIPVASHIFGKWYVVTEPTMDEAGVRAHKCYNCEMTEEAELPKLFKYTATFVADGDIVATVDFPEDATEIEIPEVPHKDKFNGEWENFDVRNKNFTVNAVYTPIPTEQIDGITAGNTADYYSSTGEVEINLNVSAPSKTIVTTTTKAVPLDIIFVLDQSGSMADGGKENALKNAVSSFSNEILADAIANSVDHRIAVVGFASGNNDNLNYGNTELLTADVVKYNKITNADYNKALVSVNDNGALNEAIADAVKAIDAEGATRADLGLEMASSIFANNPAEDGRQRVVVFLTDGVPTRYSNFEYGVANVAIQNAYQLKNTYDATVYSVGVFDAETSANRAVNNFMNYVSSNYNEDVVMSQYSKETTENTNGYYLDVSDVSTLSDVFTSIVEETTTHTGRFSNATLKYTLTKYFTLTSVQEDAIRKNAIEALGVTNEQITITRNADGTTTVVITGVEPWAEGEEFVIDFTFRATANGNTLKSGTYQVGTFESGVILENGEGYEAVFAPNSVDIGGTSGIAVFNINSIPYAINRLSSTTKVVAPATSFGTDYNFIGWNVPANLTLNNEVRVFDAELLKNEYKISWNIDGEITEVKYAVGDFITTPEVGNNSIGGAFVGWDREIPETMPSENLTITAIYDAHYHKYDVTKDFELCTEGGTLTYTCECGDTYTEEIAPCEHSWEVITASNNQNAIENAGSRCTVCGIKDSKALRLEGKATYQMADASYNTATVELDYVDETGDKHQPDGDIEISVQLDEVFEQDIPEDATASVYRVNDDGSRTLLESEQNGMNMTFETDHFSTYEFEFTTGEQKYIFAQNGSMIDYENKLIFSNTYGAKEFKRLVTYLAPAKLTSAPNNYGYFGTGTSIELTKDAVADDYTVIINGDLNGDGVCDVLDASYAALVASKKKTATQEEMWAANGYVCDEFDVNSYQNVVNMSLAS